MSAGPWWPRVERRSQRRSAVQGRCEGALATPGSGDAKHPRPAVPGAWLGMESHLRAQGGKAPLPRDEVLSSDNSGCPVTGRTVQALPRKRLITFYQVSVWKLDR